MIFLHIHVPYPISLVPNIELIINYYIYPMNIFKLSALCLLTATIAFAQQKVQQASPPVAPPATYLPVAPQAAPPASAPATPPRAAAPVAAPQAPAPVAAPAAIPPAFLDSIIYMDSAPSSSSEAVVYAPVSSSSAEAPAVPEGKTIFDSVRGHSYNPYGTVGAASSVRDLVSTPSDINGQKFFYVAPIDQLGYTAFPAGSGSILLGLDQSPIGRPAALVLGYANSSFGFAIDYSVGKVWHSDKTTDLNQRTTLAGDNIGLYFSIPIGSATLYANTGWLTYGRSYSTDVKGDETSEDFSEIKANVGLTGSVGSLNYDGYLNVIRTGGTRVDKDDNKDIDENSFLGTALNFNLSYAVLENSIARVLIGSNNFFFIKFLDKIGKSKSDNQMGLVISPNILGEVALTENWLAFAGAAHSINLISGDGDRNNKTYDLSISHNIGTDASAGVRYQRTGWAVEASVAKEMFNNPFRGFNDRNMFYSFGGFINF